jgi:hypothetical protein
VEAPKVEVKPPWPEVPKAPETPAPPPPAAEVEFKVPEGEQVDEAFVKQFKETCKANGMTSKQAQAIVDLQYGRTAEWRKQEAARLKSIDSKNMEALKSDPDFGAAKFEENMEVAKKGFVQYGSPELTRKLTAMGLQSDPEIVKHFYKLGKASGEGQTPRPPQPSPEAQTKEQELAARYPNTDFNADVGDMPREPTQAEAGRPSADLAARYPNTKF